MTRSPRDDLEFAPVHLRFELEQVEQRGDVTTIRRARERATGRSVGIERALPAFAAESESRLAFAALDDSRSQLRHPHVLEHYDVAVDDESPYSVVEWPAGGTLAERLVKRGPLGELELLKVARSVSSALEHAAARRIHHGGVVPENLCLTADGGVKVAGFGFDRLRAASRTGRPGEADPAAADVHELCRTLYRLATAAERFEAERIARLPEWLRELLGRGLDDPARRFRDAAEFLAALERLRQVAFGGGRGDSYEPTVGITPRAATGAGEDTARAPGSGSGSKGSGSKGSGSGGRRGSPDEFPWRPLDEQYELVGVPKQGGMGAVFQARELATGRFVAVKRMKPGVSIDQDAWRRFHREASSIANLNHPHVLHLMQAGRDEHGDYLVLEWASGGSLLEKIQTQGRLDAKDVFALARKIGSALVYAHGKGCIHRDIKPHNILISDSGEPKLADFGLARTLGDETLTTAGGGAGSLHYMAPEQSEDARHADERSDLYSFAKTLYHAATGRKPIAIDGAALPVGLRKPLLKAISDRREDRHASMAEFLADLERGARSKPRNGRTIAAAVVVLGALAAGATILKDEFVRRDRSGRIAETPGSDAGAGAPTTPPRSDASDSPPDPRAATPLAGTSDASAAPDSEPAPEVPAETTAPAQEGAEPAVVATAGDPAVAQPDPDPPAPSPPAADPEPNPQETRAEPATGTGAPEEDPSLAARYGEMIQSAAAWDDEWRAIVAIEGEGSRALIENDDRRAGLEAWERARALRESDLRAAVREAENAVHALRRGFSLATVVWLRGALDAAIAPGSAGFDPDRVEGLLGELRGYVPEFATAEELQRYSTAVLARAREATKTGDAAKESSGADPTAAPKEGEAPSDPAAGSDPETAPGPVDPDDPWSVAIDAIRRHPGYGGLVIAKDPALRPLGPDPGSGLFEFLLEGSGEPPEFAAGKAVVAADTGIVLVLVPGGSTHMGSNPNRAAVTAGAAHNFDPESQKSEQPEHAVELAPFLIGKHELTAAQWSRLAGLAASGSVAPASGMTWAQAGATLEANGLTLPTEAQWEHACRGGASTPWHTGSDAESARDAGHLRFVPPIPGRPLDQPLPVGSLAANGFGLHDVMGNVAEYCRDPWPGDHTRARHAPGDGLRTEASGPFRVFRGGCFKDHPKRARSAARDFCPADNVGMKTSVIGIRVARAIGVP